MPADPLVGLLKEGRTVSLPSPAKEAAARRLAGLGLVRVEEQRVVRCVNPLDPDQRYVKDISCTGKRLLEPHLDEQDHAYRCPECSRLLFPSRKQTFGRLRLWPDLAAMAAWLDAELHGLDRPVVRAIDGLWRIESAAGEVEVCLVDVCADRSVLHPQYARSGMLVFVVGNDRDYRRHLPAGAPVFRLVDLVEQGASSLRRKVRQLGKRQQASVPAVICAPGGLPPAPSPSRASPFPDVRTCIAPAGTRWNQVAVYQVDGLTVQLRVPGRSPEAFTAAELGMVNKRKRDRSFTKKWAILMALCEGDGSCGWRGHASSFDAFKVQVSALRPLLCHIFGIEQDPFMACTRVGGLRAAFVARPLPDDPPYVGEDRW